MSVKRFVRRVRLSGSRAWLSGRAIQRQNRARVDICGADAAVGLSRRVFAIPKFAFDLHISTLTQIASPICQFVPADHAMPLRPRLVLRVAVLFPTGAGGERKAG